MIQPIFDFRLRAEHELTMLALSVDEILRENKLYELKNKNKSTMNKELLGNPDVKEIAHLIYLKFDGKSNFQNQWDSFVKENGHKPKYEILRRGTFGTAPIAIKLYPIHSVKRLLDGLTFTILDYVKFAGFEICGRISKFHPKGGDLFVEVDGMFEFGIEPIRIELAKHIQKVPIFKTDDEVYIFKGDEYWFIYPQFTIGYVDKAISNMNGALGCFSTKEKAEEYVLMNNPCLSINDILKSDAIIWDSILGQNLKAYLIQIAKLKV